MSFILAKKLAESMMAHKTNDVDARRKCYVLAGMGLIMLLGLILFVFAGVYYEAVNDAIMKDNWGIFFILYGIILIGLLKYVKSGIRMAFEPLIFALVLFCVLMTIFYGFIHLTNGILDNSNPRVVSAVIIHSKQIKRTCIVYFEHWDDSKVKVFKRIPNRDMGKITLYKSRITAQTRKGFWGYEYYVIGTFRIDS